MEKVENQESQVKATELAKVEKRVLGLEKKKILESGSWKVCDRKPNKRIHLWASLLQRTLYLAQKNLP